MMVKIIMLTIIILIFPLQLSAIVFTQKQWVDLYLRDCTKKTTACRQNLEIIIGRMIKSSKMIFRYLDKEDLPRWLVSVPIVESSYIPTAVSKKGALGLWQIMPFNIEAYKTKKVVILDFEIVPTNEKIKKYAFNPKTSTQIASLHFSMLFNEYRDHKEVEKLALLAYNAGVKRVNSWLAGKAKLPEETQNYYNKIMAVNHIIANMAEYNIQPVTIEITWKKRIMGLI